MRYWPETLQLFHCERPVLCFPIYLLLCLCPQILVCCISLSLSSASFFISLENISLPHGLSRSMLFGFQALVLFHDWFPVDSIVVVEHTLRYVFQICWAYVFHNRLLKHFKHGFFKNHHQIQHVCDLGAGVYWLSSLCWRPSWLVVWWPVETQTFWVFCSKRLGLI